MTHPTSLSCKVTESGWCLKYITRVNDGLSFLQGHSVNDGIDPVLCSLSYTTVDEIAARVSLLGTGTLMAKIDIESA